MKLITGLIFGSVLFIVIATVLIYSQADNIMRQYCLSGTDEIQTINDVVTVHKNSAIEIEDIDEMELEYIGLSIPVVDTFLDIKNKIEFDVLMDKGDCSALTYPIGKVIHLYDCPTHYLPFVHEYLHVVFGVFEELWFTEGFATYLSMAITNESSLRFYNDGNTGYFLSAWKSDINTNIDWHTRKELSFIEDLKIKYNRTEVDSIISFDAKLKFHRLRSPVEFYRLSSSFCEFLCAEIGQEKVIELAEKRSYFNDSFIDICHSDEINLREIYDDWLLRFEPS